MTSPYFNQLWMGGVGSAFGIDGEVDNGAGSDANSGLGFDSSVEF